MIRTAPAVTATRLPSPRHAAVELTRDQATPVAEGPATQPIPTAAVTPLHPLARRAARYLAGTRIRADHQGRPTADGTKGEHAAGLLDSAGDDGAAALAGLTPTDTQQLVDDLTASMQGYAAHAKLASYADLIPFLAKTLVCNGWVVDEPGR